MNPALAPALRRRGLDCVSTYEAGHGGKKKPDAEQLAYAAAQGRVLITFNLVDYQRLVAIAFARGQTHPGVLGLAPGLRYLTRLADSIVQYIRQHRGLSHLQMGMDILGR